MRIFLSCLQSLRPHPIAAHDFWRQYFVRGAEEAGMTVLEASDVDWAEALVYSDSEELAAWRERTWTRVLRHVRLEHHREPIQYFLGYLYPQHVEKAAIEELQRLGIRCVNFFCDNVRQFQGVPAAYHCFDLHWVPEFEALSMYRQARLPHVHAPMPVWVAPHLRTCEHPDTEPATFIGSADILRRDLLGRALQEGADVKIRGVGWTGATDARSVPASFSRRLINQGRFVRSHGLRAWGHKLGQTRPMSSPSIPDDRVEGRVSPEDYVRVTQQAVVTIGINRVPTFFRPLSRPLTYSRLRDVEAPMLGACYLTEWTEGLPHLFDLGEEIESYRSPEELAEKLSALRGDPARRRRMRRAGQARALGQHTVANSLKTILAHLS